MILYILICLLEVWVAIQTSIAFLAAGPAWHCFKNTLSKGLATQYVKENIKHKDKQGDITSESELFWIHFLI